MMIGGVAAIAAFASAAIAQPTESCAVAAHLAHAQMPLLHAAAAIEKQRQLSVSVFGTGSSMLHGPSGQQEGYPTWLQSTLASRLQGVAVSVINAAKQKQTAADMVADFDRLVTAEKPALVVWQTGTTDAIRGIDPDEFRSALEAGIDKLQAGGVDVVLMNMQYSPRTESLIAMDVYAENIQGVAIEREIPLFDRLAVMKEWSDRGTFDLAAGSKDPVTAEQVHACIGQLLADFVVEAVNLGQEAQQVPKEAQ
jgi:ABC-type amino acid transport substrate-binding protein